MVQPGITAQGSLFTRETWTTGIKDIHGISGVALQISTVCICLILLQLGSWNDDGRILPFGHLLGLETGLILYPCLMCCTQDFTAFVSLEFEPHPNGRAEQARRRQKQRHPEWCRISAINGKGGQIIYVCHCIDSIWYILIHNIVKRRSTFVPFVLLFRGLLVAAVITFWGASFLEQGFIIVDHLKIFP